MYNLNLMATRTIIHCNIKKKFLSFILYNGEEQSKLFLTCVGIPKVVHIFKLCIQANTHDNKSCSDTSGYCVYRSKFSPVVSGDISAVAKGSCLYLAHISIHTSHKRLVNMHV
ncbi:Pleckstrin like proteiny-like domain family A member 1 [Platysternon megacephalum]|uniref:Pleckstrin like proteiny-like domain family A member 1 n=1 Tax=Platysternon megacephalum TaxID=55544 RepID=A0A4D9ERA0_9SAUR|nr:Pleckstrin like proteiny-like domain family A member 1 [Platysternon megacephalum]